MPLEPAVIESIKVHNRKLRNRKLALMAPFLLAVITALAMLVLSIVVRIINNGAASAAAESSTALFVIVRIFVGLPLFFYCLMLIASTWSRVCYAQGRYRWFTTQILEQYNVVGFQKFVEAVDGVSIAAGVPAPTLVVLDDPSANAVVFTGLDGARWMGVTNGLLRADVPVNEANAIMAHELAHAVIGQDVDPPSPTDIEFLPAFLLGGFGILATLTMLTTNSRGLWLAQVIVFALIIVILVLLQRSQSFLMRQLDFAYHHDDILADGIAVTLTHDPLAMRSVIQKLVTLAEKTDRIPGGMVMARYLFVTPPTQSGDYYRFSTQDVASALSGERQPRTWMLMQKPMNNAMMSMLACEERVTKDRMVALDVIAQGRVRSVSDWDRD